jgi:hypothetical protein
MLRPRVELDRTALFASAKLSCNPIWTATAIQHGMHDSAIVFEFVVDGVGKAFRQHSVIAANDSVNSGVELQRIDIRYQRTGEVASQPFRLAFVERRAVVEIAEGGLENSDFQG